MVSTNCTDPKHGLGRFGDELDLLLLSVRHSVARTSTLLRAVTCEEADNENPDRSFGSSNHFSRAGAYPELLPVKVTMWESDDYRASNEFRDPGTTPLRPHSRRTSCRSSIHHCRPFRVKRLSRRFVSPKMAGTPDIQ